MNSTRIRTILAVAIGCTLLVAGGASVTESETVDTSASVGPVHGGVDGGDVNITLDSIEGASASYGDSLPVAGEAAVDGDPVDEVPIGVTLADEELGAVETTDGAFDGSVAVPASVPAGEHDLAVTLGVEDRAIESATETVPVTVHETESRLAIDAVPAEDGVRMGGLLTTSDGVPVADQPVELAVDGETVATVTSGPDGEFETTEPVSSTSTDATVVATYEGVDSSLESSESSTAVDASIAGPTSDAVGWPVGMYALGGVGVLVVLVAGWALVRYLRARRRRSRTHSVLRRQSRNGRVTSRSVTHRPASSQRPKSRSVATGEPLSHSLLSRASAELSNGRTNAAVRSAYAAARFELQSTVEECRTCTHWEFAHTYRGPGTDELERLTERYEVAAFDRRTVSAEHAHQTLLLAKWLVDLRDDTGDGTTITDETYGAGQRDRGITIVD